MVGFVLFLIVKAYNKMRKQKVSNGGPERRAAREIRVLASNCPVADLTGAASIPQPAGKAPTKASAAGFAAGVALAAQPIDTAPLAGAGRRGGLCPTTPRCWATSSSLPSADARRGDVETHRGRRRPPATRRSQLSQGLPAGESTAGGAW